MAKIKRHDGRGHKGHEHMHDGVERGGIGKSPVIQNRGAGPVHPEQPSAHQVGGTPLAPRTGTQAVEMRGTSVHAAPHDGITRPTHKTAGSHDHVIREHAEHVDGHLSNVEHGPHGYVRHAHHGTHQGHKVPTGKHGG